LPSDFRLQGYHTSPDAAGRRNRIRVQNDGCWFVLKPNADNTVFVVDPTYLQAPYCDAPVAPGADRCCDGGFYRGPNDYDQDL
jgi:hypothetical protein